MESIGEQLSSARLAQGLAIDEIAEKTRIRRRYIVALEENEHAAFPAKVYAISFLRQYSDALGLPSDALVQERCLELAAARELPRQAHCETVGRVSPGLHRSALTKIQQWAHECVVNRSDALLAGALILVGVIAWRYVGQSQVITEATPLTSVDSGSVPSAEPTQASLDETLAVELQASGEAWVRISADGGSTQDMILQTGSEVKLEARERVQVTVGNAGAISVLVNQRNLGSLGAVGQVRHIELNHDGWKALPSGSF